MRWGITAKLLLIPAVATVMLLWALGLTFHTHGSYEHIIREMADRRVSLSKSLASLENRNTQLQGRAVALLSRRLLLQTPPRNEAELNRLVIEGEAIIAALEAFAERAKPNATERRLIDDTTAQLSDYRNLLAGTAKRYGDRPEESRGLLITLTSINEQAGATLEALGCLALTGSRVRAIAPRAGLYLRRCIEIGREADGTGLGRGRVHELADRLENAGDHLVVIDKLATNACFEFLEPPCELLVGSEQLAHARERSHDLDVDRDRALALEHGRQHGNALFGKRMGQILTVPSAAAL